MNFLEITEIDDSKFFGLLAPIKRAWKSKKNPLIIGFDTEYVYRDDKQITLTIQFSTDGITKVIPIHMVSSPEDLLIREAIFPTAGLEVQPTNIDKEVLFLELLSFLALFTIRIPRDEIYLISHFAQAEFSNLDSLDDIDIFQANNALFGTYKVIHPTTGAPIKIHIKDLFGIFKTSLEKIGDSVGIPKISLDGIGDKQENYWKENMDELYEDHQAIFAEYAGRDSEICFHAYTNIRNFFLDKYDIDMLHSNTLATLAGYLFRKDYLSESVFKSRTIRTPRKQKRALVDGTTKYYDVIQKLHIFAGDLNVRLSALEAYHGARVESFYRGRIEDANLVYYDVDSLYPSSAMLQPLPCNDTSWINLAEINYGDNDSLEELINTSEGFIEVEFNFPDSTMYPCLPVSGARDSILYFPLNGISWCTISELRLAIKLGLEDYKILSGYAFEPTATERDHTLKKYMEDIHSLKNSSDKGSIEYELYKLLMNALVGKLVERNEEQVSIDLVKEGLLNRDALHKYSRRVKKSKYVGSLWIPEWAALILGRSRALISEFVAKGSLMVSADSVLLPSDVDIYCDALVELESVGSTLKKEFDVTHGVLIRTRLYVLNPFESDVNKQRIARHGVHCPSRQFLEIMRDGFKTKEIPELSYSSKRLIKYQESIRTGKALNSEEIYDSSINLKYDGKRKLLEPTENPFAEGSWSIPLNSVDVVNNVQRKPPRAKVGRKKGSRLNTEKRKAIIEMYKDGYKQADISRELGVSKGYVSKVVNQIGIVEDNTKCQKQQPIASPIRYVEEEIPVIGG